MLKDLIADLFARTCHQWTDRCLVVGDAVFPLCARCMGIYVGVAVVGFWWLCLEIRGRRPRLGRWALRLATAAVVFCLVDGISGASHLWDNGNVFRFCVGFLAGLGGSLRFVCWLDYPRRGTVMQAGLGEALLVVLAVPPILIALFSELHDVLICLTLFGFVCSRAMAFFGAIKLIWVCLNLATNRALFTRALPARNRA